jgi:hypothetical protein
VNKIRNTKHRVIETLDHNELWEVDLGRIPHNGENHFVLVAIDHYSKWTETKHLKNKEGETIKNAIEELIINKHGIPKTILTDCGLEFNNRHINKLKTKYGFKWKYSSTEHHNTVGGVKRVNQTFWTKVKKLTNFGETSWKNALQKATHAVNISYNRAIGTSPFIFKYARSPEFMIDKDFGRESIKFTRLTLNKKRKEHFNKYKKSIEKGKITAPSNFLIGDKVLIYREINNDKLKSNWQSGYEVTDIILPDGFMVKKDKSLIRVNKAHIKHDLSLRGREMS